MTIDIFRNGMQHDIRTMVQWILHIRTHKSVIHNHLNVIRMRNLGNLLDVHQSQRRVRRRLDPDQLGILGPDQLLHVHLDGRSKSHMNAMGRSHLGEVSMRSTVDVGDGNNMRARGQGLEYRSSGGRARSEG